MEGAWTELMLTANAKHRLVIAHDNQKCYFPFELYSLTHSCAIEGFFLYWLGCNFLWLSVCWDTAERFSAAGFSNSFFSLNYIMKLGVPLFPVQALCRLKRIPDCVFPFCYLPWKPNNWPRYNDTLWQQYTLLVAPTKELIPTLKNRRKNISTEKGISDSICSKNLLHMNKLVVPQNWFAFI